MNLSILPLEERIVLDAAAAADQSDGDALAREVSPSANSRRVAAEARGVENTATQAMEEIRRSLNLVRPVPLARTETTAQVAFLEGERISDSRFSEYVDRIMHREE
ncbi:MAG: hypothetical protein ACYTGH_13305 [Planctomycetota bacterium]|jgi:hypothetical protein